MAFSQKLIQAVLAPNTGEVFLFLLTFNHPSFRLPIHLVNNLENISSRGVEYQAFPLELTLPADDGDSLPTIEITCQNASLELIDEVRSITGPMSLKLEFILASQPDIVEFSIQDMRVATVQYDKDVLKMSCTVDDLLSTSFPAHRYLPSNFAGLFK
jgi:hypothetical protein